MRRFYCYLPKIIFANNHELIEIGLTEIPIFSILKAQALSVSFKEILFEEDLHWQLWIRGTFGVHTIVINFKHFRSCAMKSFQTTLLLYLWWQQRRVLADSIGNVLDINKDLEEYKTLLTGHQIPAIEDGKKWEQVPFVQSIKISKNRLGIHEILIIVGYIL